MEKLGLETYKITLSFIVLVILGGIIENWYAESTRKTERELVVLEQAIQSFKNFGASLASLRASVYRLRNMNSSAKDIDFYQKSYESYTNSKLPFVMSMQLSSLGSESEMKSFKKLNQTIIDVDICIALTIREENSSEPCKLVELYDDFLELSTAFEGVVIDALSDKEVASR